MTESTPDIVGVGVLMFDNLAVVPHLPGPDDRIIVDDFTIQGGGNVSTALVASARLGACSGFVGRVADDYAGAFMRAELEAEGIDIAHLDVQPARRSPHSMIVVLRDTGQRSIIGHLGTTDPLESECIPERYVAGARYLHLDRSDPGVLAAAKIARRAGVIVSVDGDHCGRREAELIGLADFLIGSERWGKTYHQGDPLDACKVLLERTEACFSGITLGTSGSVGIDRTGEVHRAPAFDAPQLVDTTGCGDVYHGAFLVGQFRGLGYSESMTLAAAAAALKCRKLGGRAGIPDDGETLAFLRSHGVDLGQGGRTYSQRGRVCSCLNPLRRRGWRRNPTR